MVDAGENSLSGMQTAAFSAHMMEKELWCLVSCSYKCTSLMGSGLHLNDFI